MNSLKREIEPGEIVVLKENIFPDKSKSRLFRCEDGYGMFPFTLGVWIDGQGLGVQLERVSGIWIDPEATEAYQSEHGKFGERS